MASLAAAELKPGALRGRDGGSLGLTADRCRRYHSGLMSMSSPGSWEVERAVATQRVFAERVPLAAFERLRGLIAHTDGDIQCSVAFERNALGQPIARIEATGSLPLVCQLSLETYLEPVALKVTLGLIRREDDERGLPEGYEARLVEDGLVDPLALVEEELIMAVPVVPRDPKAVLPAPAGESVEGATRESPFAALKSLQDRLRAE